MAKASKTIKTFHPKIIKNYKLIRVMGVENIFKSR